MGPRLSAAPSGQREKQCPIPEAGEAPSVTRKIHRPDAILRLSKHGTYSFSTVTKVSHLLRHLTRLGPARNQNSPRQHWLRSCFRLWAQSCVREKRDAGYSGRCVWGGIRRMTSGGFWGQNCVESNRFFCPKFNVKPGRRTPPGGVSPDSAGK